MKRPRKTKTNTRRPPADPNAAADSGGSGADLKSAIRIKGGGRGDAAYVIADGVHCVNMPALGADHLQALEVSSSSYREVPGDAGYTYIGHMQINPTDGAGNRLQPPRQERPKPPRRGRLRNKSTASIPEIPWKRNSPA